MGGFGLGVQRPLFLNREFKKACHVGYFTKKENLQFIAMLFEAKRQGIYCLQGRLRTVRYLDSAHFIIRMRCWRNVEIKNAILKSYKSLNNS